MPLAIFGEKVLYKPLDHQKDKSKIDAKWESGIWLGVARESNEALVGDNSRSYQSICCQQKNGGGEMG